MKYCFTDIFDLQEDGSVSSKFAIRFFGSTVTLSPGTLFKPGVLFNDIDIARMTENEIKGTLHEEHGEEVFVITRFC